jgi:hypothetical protein
MKKSKEGDPRTLERIEDHYRIERELANRLRWASQADRQHLYSALYD